MPPGRIIVYASSHGWGHNARLMPIIDQLWEYQIEIASTAPEWFIVKGLNHKRKFPIVVRPLKTDPGCVQTDPFTINLEETINSWADVFHNKDRVLAEELAMLKKGPPVRLVISDISYFGVLVAEALGVPSICVATFDWAFIYQNERKKSQEFSELIDKVQEISARFDCCLVPGTECKPLHIGKQKFNFHWLSRKPSLDRTDMREKLGLTLYMDSALLSFGGHTLNSIDPQIWRKFEDIQFFVLLPECECITEPAPNVHFLVNEKWSRYHTDLVNTVDVVFGKLGYGLCSEVAACRKPILFVESKWNPEVPELENFMKVVVPIQSITPEQFLRGEWEGLLSLIETQRDPEIHSDIPIDGEVQISKWIRDYLHDPEPKESKFGWQLISMIVFVIAILIFYLSK